MEDNPHHPDAKEVDRKGPYREEIERLRQELWQAKRVSLPVFGISTLGIQ